MMSVCPRATAEMTRQHGLSRRTVRRGDFADGFQFADVRRLLRTRPRHAFAAAAVDREEGQSAHRELYLLFGLEPAVRDPAVDFDRGRLVRGAGAGQGAAA